MNSMDDRDATHGRPMLQGSKTVCVKRERNGAG